MPSIVRKPHQAPRRSRTVSLKALGQDAVKIGALLYPERDFWRPQIRADCAKFPRPCPYVGCIHHLYVDEGHGDDSLRFAFPDLEPWELPKTCTLDLVEQAQGTADGFHMTLEEIGDALGVTKERVRQILDRTIAKIVHGGLLGG